MTWKNFTRDEFACKCGCGTNEMKAEVIDFAQELRSELGFAMPITSGYRCPNHPRERQKMKAGTHSRGIAFDVGLSGGKAKMLAKLLLQKNRGGVGVNQKGSARFIHADVDQQRLGLFWSY